MDVLTFLNETGQKLVFDLSNSIQQKGLRASGRLQKSLTYEIKQQDEKFILIVSGKRYIGALEFGRKPSRRNEGGKLLDAIKQWIKDKGLNLNPYAVTKKIHKFGIKVPNKYNKGNVVSDVFNQKRIDEIKKDLAKIYSGEIKTAISNVLKKQF